MSKKPNNIERRVGWEAVTVFLFAVAFCTGIIIYTSQIAGSVETQRENIHHKSEILLYTNNFTQAIHEAQAEANMSAFSENKAYKEAYLAKKNMLGSIIDTILMLSSDREQDSATISEILLLLDKKEETTDELSLLFNQYNPWDALSQIINDYKPTEQPSFKITSTTVRDTVIKSSRRKSFWQRLSDAFYPSDEHDSIVFETKTQIDTINPQKNDSINILNEIRIYSDEASSNYIMNLDMIEKKIQTLISYDQNISRQIEELLVRLHKSTIDSTLDEIKRSEELIRKNNTNSIISCCVALALILVLTFMIISDINKGYRSRKELEAAKRRTDELMESRHRMLLSVSHDIKAPLSSIIGNLELMSLENANSKEADRQKSMQSSATHIMNMLSNLLDFSSLEQGKLTANINRFRLNELCESMTSMFESAAKRKGLEFIHTESFAHNTIVESDEVKIKQILTNLISNAIKYTITGKVRFDTRQSDGNIVFEVSDTGTGIPDDQLDLIFKPFSRIANTSKAEGNGYGLFVVKGFVELLDGTIDVKSEKDKGTSITVTIPTAASIENESEPDKTPSASKRLSILITDDDNSLLSVLEEILQRLGHKATICCSMSDFEVKINKLSDYDLVLTDKEMGAVSGRDILKRIKERDPMKKVFLMTARTEYETEKAIEEGFDGFIHKPFTIKQIADMLNTRIEPAEQSGDLCFDRFPTLCTMLGNDEGAIRKVLHAFATSTADNLVKLNEAVDDNDFKAAQSLCHKMLPMFIELDQTHLTDYLSKMDSLRDKSETQYADWQNDTVAFMNEADNTIQYIEELMEQLPPRKS